MCIRDSFLPTLILFGGLIVFWVFMMRRLGNSMGGGDKQMNFCLLYTSRCV